jgi:hypothetical protein
MSTIVIPADLREFLIAAAAGDLQKAADTIHSGTLSAYPWPLIDGPVNADERAKYEAARVAWRTADRTLDQLSTPAPGEGVELDKEVAQRLVEESIGQLRECWDNMSSAPPGDIMRGAEALLALDALAAERR